jgi:SAM-dependent methyltransferase
MEVAEHLRARTRLHLGSGLRYDPEAVNVDVVAAGKPDLLHDLNRRPWPLPDDRFESVVMWDVLEHLDDTLGVLEEVHRVCRPGAWVHIIVPHFSSNGAFTDPTHRRYFSALTFDYFTEGHPQSFYTARRFRVERRRIVFRPTLLNKLVWRLANRFPQAYENAWAWMFPAWFISVEMTVVKPASGSTP